MRRGLLSFTRSIISAYVGEILRSWMMHCGHSRFGYNYCISPTEFSLYLAYWQMLDPKSIALSGIFLTITISKSLAPSGTFLQLHYAERFRIHDFRICFDLVHSDLWSNSTFSFYPNCFKSVVIPIRNSHLENLLGDYSHSSYISYISMRTPFLFIYLVQHYRNKTSPR